MTEFFDGFRSFFLPPIAPDASFSPFLAYSGTSGSGEGEVYWRQVCTGQPKDSDDKASAIMIYY